MKIDICDIHYTQKEICSDIKYCCIFMKSMIKRNHIEIDIHNEAVYYLRIDEDNDHMRFYPYEYMDKDIVELNWKVRIQYCPFCGDKLE